MSVIRLKHKYGAKRTRVNELSFPSKLEANVYLRLKELEEQGIVRLIIRQPKLDLPAGKRHAVDFLVFTETDCLFIEAKGRDLENGRLRRELCESIHDIKIHVVKSPAQLGSLFAV